MTSAQRIFYAAYGPKGPGRNFMTPNVIEYGHIGPTVVYELSEGSGFEPGTRLFGITVVGITPGGEAYKRDDLSGCCTGGKDGSVLHTLAQARQRIASLQELAGLETADA